MTRHIQQQYFFAHPPATVWEYLTNSDLLALWLMKNNFRPIVGAAFEFRTNPIPALDFDGIFHWEVLTIDPMKSLSYSWRSGPGGKKITLDSVVVWTLEATEKGTNLLLDHSGFAKAENLDFYNGLLHGWLEKFSQIEKLLKERAHGQTHA